MAINTNPVSQTHPSFASEPDPTVATLSQIVIPRERPHVIFLDAVGTLFGVQGSVGHIYALLAKRHGVSVDIADLNRAFFQSFQASPPGAFPHADPAVIPQLEYNWWLAIARNTFSTVGVVDQFTDFDAFFQDVFAYFATADAWFLYPDVMPTLTAWQQQGLQLAVISNFDSRLYPVLQVLGLQDFFASVTISTAVGAAKPDRAIFDQALQKHGCEPAQAWHIGDSHRDDFLAASAVGIRGIWLNRVEPLIPLNAPPLAVTNADSTGSSPQQSPG